MVAFIRIKSLKRGGILLTMRKYIIFQIGARSLDRKGEALRFEEKSKDYFIGCFYGYGYVFAVLTAKS